MTKIIGLTGGIGSGKTTIAKYLKSFGIPVYIADDEARKIMQSSEIINAIKNTFGEDIFENGILNREKLAKIVFNDPEKLKN
jgi:dephospho-CoA kinase